MLSITWFWRPEPVENTEATLRMKRYKIWKKKQSGLASFGVLRFSLLTAFHTCENLWNSWKDRGSWWINRSLFLFSLSQLPYHCICFTKLWSRSRDVVVSQRNDWSILLLKANHSNFFCAVCLLLENFLDECCLRILHSIVARMWRKISRQHYARTVLQPWIVARMFSMDATSTCLPCQIEAEHPPATHVRRFLFQSYH